jgi:hypothetical protein
MFTATESGLMSTIESALDDYPVDLRTVRLLESDLELASNGVSIQRIVDPHDLIEFCFPLGLYSKSRSHGVSSDMRERIAEYQAGYHVLFYEFGSEPILFSEYSYELEALEGFIRWKAERVYSALDIAEELVKRRALSGDVPPGHAHRIVRLVEEDFSVAVAVVLGLFATGVDRLASIIKNRLRSEDVLQIPPVTAALQAFRPTQLADDLFTKIERQTKPREAETPLDRQRRVRGIQSDTRAIEKLLLINQQAFDSSVTHGTRSLFLYASSAARSRNIFELPSVKSRLPIVGGEPYSVLRDRRYWFAMAAHKVAVNGRLDVRGTLAAVKQTRQQLERVQSRLEGSPAGSVEQCDSCVLAGGAAEVACAMQELCKDVSELRSSISRYKEHAGNLRMSVNAEVYAHLLGRAREQVRASGQNLQVEQCITLVKDVLDNLPFRNRALNRMRDLNMLAELFAKQEDVDTAGTNDGNITVGVQRLPIKIRFANDNYRSIAASIVDYCSSSRAERTHTRARFEEAYAAFLNLSNDSNPSAEHELVRCLICLAFPAQGGDQSAYEGALEGASLFTDFDREFRYVACWAARRTEQFKTADVLCRSALAKYGSDPRFHHGLSLNCFAWWLKSEDSAPGLLSEAIVHADAAIAAYRHGDFEANADVIAACLHNLAFFLTVSRDSSVFDPKRGRTVLEQLKATLGRSQWLPRFPEYHHGEALVEYREYQAIQMSASPAEICNKLMCAMDAVNDALSVQKKPQYLALKAKLNAVLVRHDCAGFRRIDIDDTPL